MAGKGGTGKTTFSSLLIRYLVEQGETPVLAVDADPNANLGELLGLRPSVSVGALREKSFAGEAALRDIPPGWDKRTWTEYRMHQAVAEGPGFDVLEMGRPEGPGCYCLRTACCGACEHAGARTGGGHGQRGRFGAPQPACLPSGGRDVPTLRSFTAGIAHRRAHPRVNPELKLDVGQVVLVMNGLRPGRGKRGDHRPFTSCLGMTR